MKKQGLKTMLILSLFLVSLLSGLMMSTFTQAASEPTAPNWALDPEKHSNLIGDYDLLAEKSTTYSDMLTEKTVSAWRQVWISPKGCVDDPSTNCNTILATLYINTSSEISEEVVEDFREGIAKSKYFEDITEKVPGAALSFILDLSIDIDIGDLSFSIGTSFGFTIYNTMKHYMFIMETTANVQSSSSSNLRASSDLADSMEELMIAAGTAANQALNSIPGYDLLVILGVSSIMVSAMILTHRRKHKR